MKPGDKITIERLDDGSYSIDANGFVFILNKLNKTALGSPAVFSDEGNASLQRLVERMRVRAEDEVKSPAPVEPAD